jgi:hypothetical protein
MLEGTPGINPVRKVALVVTWTNTLGSVHEAGGASQSTIQALADAGLH